MQAHNSTTLNEQAPCYYFNLLHSRKCPEFLRTTSAYSLLARIKTYNNMHSNRRQQFISIASFSGSYLVPIFIFWFAPPVRVGSQEVGNSIAPLLQLLSIYFLTVKNSLLPRFFFTKVDWVLNCKTRRRIPGNGRAMLVSALLLIQQLSKLFQTI